MEVLLIVGIAAALVLAARGILAPAVSPRETDKQVEEAHRSWYGGMGLLLVLVVAAFVVLAAAGTLDEFAERQQQNAQQTMGAWWERRPAAIR